jgi:hypothetical protein
MVVQERIHGLYLKVLPVLLRYWLAEVVVNKVVLTEVRAVVDYVILTT